MLPKLHSPTGLRAKLTAGLFQHFGFTEFRAGQLQPMVSVMQGRDTIVVQPTSFGKSLLFQLPALILEKPALLVSPLKALQADQVHNLKKRGITACALNGDERDRKVWDDAALGKYSFIYITPESLSTWKPLQYLYQNSGISLMAIDESHSVHNWQHFRPKYQDIGNIRQTIPDVPIIAVTATADKDIRKCMTTSLQLKNPVIYQGSLDRTNLYYEIIKKNREIKLSDIVAKIYPGNPTIIYCMTRAKTKELADELTENGIPCTFYHGALNTKIKVSNMNAFMNGEINCIACTSAFGMGIDKPNVRTVIHVGVTDSLSNYCQQTGRAGRDGLSSECYLFWNKRNIGQMRWMVNKGCPDDSDLRRAFNKFCRFLNSKVCRRKQLVTYFGETWSKTNCGNCDVCIKNQ